MQFKDNTMKIFIDTNVYLDFYRSKDVATLIHPLTELSDYIIITKQIVNEVYRNKCARAVEILNDDIKKYQFRRPFIDFLTKQAIIDIDPEINEKINRVQTNAKNINKEIDELKKALEEVYQKTIEHVSKSEDKISIELEEIFKNALDHTDNQLKRAQIRKNLGNPPGKKGDPIGDELSWEQILDYSQENNCPIWVVSKDGDFMIKSNNGQPLGNSLLIKEIQERKLPEFLFFDDLTFALKKFKEEIKCDFKLPSEEELQAASVAIKEYRSKKINECEEGKHSIEIIQDGRFDVYYCTVCKRSIGAYLSDCCD